MPLDIAPGKLELLRLAGADVRFAPPGGGGVALARRIGKRPGFLNLDQYGNQETTAHAQWTTQQTWEQTKHKLTIYCAGLGTTGTALGAIQFFREHASSVTVVGVYCLPNSAIPGVRSIERLQEVSFDWEAEVPHRVGAGTAESYKKSLDLCRAGLMAGPSSGFALAGLLRFLAGQADLDSFRNSDGDVVAVFVCCDTPFPYLDSTRRFSIPPISLCQVRTTTTNRGALYGGRRRGDQITRLLSHQQAHPLFHMNNSANWHSIAGC